MFITSIDKTQPIIAGDGTKLYELLHPTHSKQSYKITYSVAYAILEKDQVSTPHRLKESTEVYIIIEGIGKVVLDKEERTVKKGDIILIPPGTIQSIQNIGPEPLSFLCIVNPPWTKDDEEILES